MKTTIPTRQTQNPSRDGLAYHEILADGLFHTAHVFGIAADDRFVERVAALAWVNAARLVQSNFWQAGSIARSLRETLETGRSESEALCRAVGDAITSSTEEPFEAVRTYYADVLQTRSLDSTSAESSDRIRQLIGEAVLAGLHSRGLIASAFQALIAHSENTRNEQRIVSNRLIYWASNDGLPRYHPFMELCVQRYDNNPERDLLCTAIARRLTTILEKGNPWEVEHWCSVGWTDGWIAATFAPDEVIQVINAIPAKSWEFNQRLFIESMVTTFTSDEKVNLPGAFADYVTRYDPYDLADDSVRAANPRLVAWSAYDFSFWMGVVAEIVRPIKGGTQ